MYLGTIAGSLYKVDLDATQTKHVSLVINVGQPIGGVVVEAGLAYLGLRSVGGGPLIVDLNEKKVVRTIKTDGAVFGRPVVDNRTNSVYFASTGGTVYRLPLPGVRNTTVKRFPIAGRARIEAGLAVVAGADADSSRLVVASVDRVVRALSATDGKQAWSSPQGKGSEASGVHLTPAAARAAGVVGVATTGCRVAALSTETRKQQWTAALGNPIRVAPVIAGTNVITANAGCVDVWKLAPPKPPEPTAVRSLYPTKCPTFQAGSLLWDTFKIYVGTTTGQVASMKFPVLASEDPSG